MLGTQSVNSSSKDVVFIERELSIIANGFVFVATSLFFIDTRFVDSSCRDVRYV